MNRFANAISAAIPSSASGSEASSSGFQQQGGPSSSGFQQVHRESRTSSPLDSHFSLTNRNRSKSPARTALYDDPRSTTESDAGPSTSAGSGSGSGLSRWDPSTYPRRPGLLKATSDTGPAGTPRAASPSPGPGSSRPRDRTVRVNVLATRKGGGGRMGAMAKGPEGKYAVGGGMALKVVQITSDTSGTATPRASDQPSPTRKPQKGPQVLGKGPGGVAVTEVVNLWRGSMAVGKGVNDVDWGAGSFANKVVTASPSGNFLIFDVNRGKLEKEVSGGHPRPMNVLRLCQTPAHAHLLVTGGTEGHTKLWDLRERDPTSRKYFKHSGAVTSLCFCPDDPHQFVVGLENGAIQRYDLRHQKNGRVWGAHGSKPVMDLQWRESDGHHSGDGWLASGGADRTVQVWDMSQSWDKVPIPVHTLHTAYPLRRVAWRPDHPTEIAIVPLQQSQATLVDPSIASVSQGLGQESVALDEDSHIEIWDVRRHHVAKYGLPTIDGAAVEAVWSDDSTLVTAYQNGMFGQLQLDHTRQRCLISLDTIPRQVMSWSPHGELAYGIDRFKQGEIPFDDPLPEYARNWDKTGQRRKGPADPAYEPLQAVGTLSLPAFDNDDFVYLANHYRIEAGPGGRGRVDELCAWNSEVASMCGRTDDARCWTLLKQFVEDLEPVSGDGEFDEHIFDQGQAKTSRDHAGNSPPPSPRAEAGSPRSSQRTISPPRPRAVQLDRVPTLDERQPDDDVEELLSTSSSSSSTRSTSKQVPERKTRFMTFAEPDAPSGSRRSTSTATATHSASMSRDRSSQLRGRNSRHRHHSSSEDEEDDAYPDPYGIIHDRNRQSSTNTSNRSSPNIPPDRRISTIKGGGSGSPLVLPTALAVAGRQGSASGSGSGSNRPSLAGSARPSLAGSARPSAFALSKKEKSAGLVPTSQGWMDPVALDEHRKARSAVILQWWRSYVDDGDAQMAATLHLVGTKVIDFPAKQAERVVHAYVEMLEHHRLAIPAAYVRRFAKLSSLEVVVGDPGVTHLAYCARCGRGTGSLEDTGMERRGKRFWYCKNCRLPAKECAICREGVRGLWMACGKCRHGGHQSCMRAFYLEKPLTLPPREASGHALSTVPSHEHDNARDHLPLYGYGSSHDSSTGLADRGRASSETARSADGPLSSKRETETVLGWTSCPQGCGCKCRIVPVHRDE